MVPCLLPGGCRENAGDLLDFEVNREEGEEEGQDKISHLCSTVALTSGFSTKQRRDLEHALTTSTL